jgi:hypothetical protein
MQFDPSKRINEAFQFSRDATMREQSEKAKQQAYQQAIKSKQQADQQDIKERASKAAKSIAADQEFATTLTGIDKNDPDYKQKYWNAAFKRSAALGDITSGMLEAGGKDLKPEEKPHWVRANPFTGEPAHYEGGKVTIPDSKNFSQRQVPNTGESNLIPSGQTDKWGNPILSPMDRMNKDYNQKATPQNSHWVPANPETGAPAHFEGAKVTFPPKPTVSPRPPKDEQLSFLEHSALAAEALAQHIQLNPNASDDEKRTATRSANAARYQLDEYRQSHAQAQPATPPISPAQPPSSAAAPKSAPQASPPPGTLRNGRKVSVVPVVGQSATQPSAAPAPAPQARITPNAPIAVTKPDTNIEDGDPSTMAGLGAFAPKLQQPSVNKKFNEAVRELVIGYHDAANEYLSTFPPEQKAAQQKKLQDAVDAIKSNQAKETANSQRIDRNTKNSSDFERIAEIAHWPNGADMSKPGGMNNPEVQEYLAQFTPKQRQVQIKALQTRAKELLDKERAERAVGH